MTDARGNLGDDVVIRAYQVSDRSAVRRIACLTAFHGQDYRDYIDDGEVLADALTGYYTDFEPGSCFVAEYQNAVIGYLIGSRDVRRHVGSSSVRVLWRMVSRAFFSGLFLKRQTWQLIFAAIGSFFKGEFFQPDFKQSYPATLHINIDSKYRRLKVGTRLIAAYEALLRQQKIPGVHFATMSDAAKRFFEDLGFKELYRSRRTYLRYRTGEEFWVYIMGKKIMMNGR